MDLRIKGRVALVTGAGRGIGAEIGRTLAAEGVRVAVNDLFEERAEESAEELRSAGAEAMSVAFDVTDYVAVEAGVRHVIEAFGQVDILVNNAGIPAATAQDALPSAGGLFGGTDRAQWDRTMGLITYGVLNCSRALIEPMTERRWAASSASSRTPGVSASRGLPPTRWRRRASSASPGRWRRRPAETASR